MEYMALIQLESEQNHKFIGISYTYPVPLLSDFGLMWVFAFIYVFKVDSIGWLRWEVFWRRP